MSALEQQAEQAIARSADATVGTLFAERVRIDRDRIAVIEGARYTTYGKLNERVNRLAHVLLAYGISPGDRVAILTRNCAAYVEAELAAAKIGAILAAQNWRLADAELAHCIALVEPRLVLVALDLVATLARLDGVDCPSIVLGEDYEAHLAKADASEPVIEVGAEAGFVILYTSGTTGFPKGALISHRAMIARALAFVSDLGIYPNDGFVAWAPFFHMVSTDHAMATLMRGGTVSIIDGYDPAALVRVIEAEKIGWLPLIPGMVEEFLGEIRGTSLKPRGIRAIGAMADLVPPHQIAEITERLQAPYVNSFGATETGLPPATADLLSIGVVPTDLAKRQSSFCQVRLVDEDDRDVPDGEPGECSIRGPTLFSGYWRAHETNAKDFRNGWFHIGDVFRRRADGRFEFMDRAKYMIKSGGENIYPAEIERVLLADPHVEDAVVVRRPDARWGEVPVAAVATNSDTLTAADLLARCRAELAGYKQPKEVRFVAFADLPRSTTGKIQRHEVECWFRGSDDKS